MSLTLEPDGHARDAASGRGIDRAGVDPAGIESRAMTLAAALAARASSTAVDDPFALLELLCHHMDQRQGCALDALDHLVARLMIRALADVHVRLRQELSEEVQALIVAEMRGRELAHAIALVPREISDA